uniref:Uncharacterized protein n=1 Tax=Ditylenchus dipsaci TaxID=166011 RepID=A0A915DW36_9BILA
MSLKLSTTKSNPHYGALLTLQASGYTLEKAVKFVENGNEVGINVHGVQLHNDASIARFYARNAPLKQSDTLLGKNAFEQAQIEVVVGLAEQAIEYGGKDTKELLELAKAKLAKNGKWLYGKQSSIADFVLFSVLTADTKLNLDGILSEFVERVKCEAKLAPAHSFVGKFQPIPTSTTANTSNKASCLSLALFSLFCCVQPLSFLPLRLNSGAVAMDMDQLKQILAAQQQQHQEAMAQQQQTMAQMNALSQAALLSSSATRQTLAVLLDAFQLPPMLKSAAALPISACATLDAGG